MHAGEAKALLGFPPNLHPTPSQVKAAYKRKAWETHPDRFPGHAKHYAETKFKLISEAYSCLRSGRGAGSSATATYSQVVRSGVPRGYGGRRNNAVIKLPFLFIILGTLALGGSNAARAYKRQTEAYPSHNPFLP